MPYHLATGFCFLAALLLYVVGLSADAQGAVVVGMCFEGFAWMRVFRKRKDPGTAVIHRD